MMGWQKKEKVIPQELQIQKIIQPTHGIITVKSVKISKQQKGCSLTKIYEQLWTAALKTSKGEQRKGCSLIKICDQLWTAALKTSKGEQRKGCSLKKICKQLWTVASKGKQLWTAA